MIGPWYRSRLFWLGVPGLFFVLWLWLGFLGRDVGGSWTSRDHGQWLIGWGDGYLSLVHRTVDWNWRRDRGWESFDSRLELMDREDRLLLGKPVLLLDHHFSTTRERSVSIAFWFLISAYVVVWLMTTLLWQRRNHRLSPKTS